MTVLAGEQGILELEVDREMNTVCSLDPVSCSSRATSSTKKITREASVTQTSRARWTATFRPNIFLM